jgi:hypothetical protein
MAVRVPRQVVVHHQIGDLEVDALTRRVSGHQDLNRRVDPEAVLDVPPIMALHAAVDRDDRFGTSQLGGDPVSDVGQGVLVLGEHDELAGSIPGPELVGTQQVAQLGPLGVGSRRPHLVCQTDELAQLDQLCFQLLRRRRSSGRVDHRVFEGFEFLVVVVVEVKVLEIGDLHAFREIDDRHRPAARRQPSHILCLFREPLQTAAQRVIDRRGRRGETALQTREREADDEASSLVALLLHLRGAVHAGADVGGHRLVQLRLSRRKLEVQRVGEPLGEDPLAFERA